MILNSIKQKWTGINQTASYQYEEINFVIQSPEMRSIESTEPIMNMCIQYLLSNRKEKPFYNPQIFTNTHDTYFSHNAAGA
jgi:hypothetical protein